MKRKKVITCPNCGTPGVKAIYMGLPIKLCMSETCCLVWGWCSWVLQYVPFNGYFFTYEGYYLPALWEYLTYQEEK